MLTFVIVDKDFLVSGCVGVIVPIPDYYSKSIGARDGRVSAVLHNDGHVVFLGLFTVKLGKRCDNTSTMFLRTTTQTDNG